MVKRTCLRCKKHFLSYPSRNKSFCSNFCRIPSFSALGVLWNKARRGHRNPATQGEKNSQWKGDKVKYGSLHDWVKWWFPKTKLCQNCGLVPPYDIANISQEYKRDLSDWEWLCRRCHMLKDGRMKNLKPFQSVHTL